MWTPPNDPAYWWRLVVQVAQAAATTSAVVIVLWDKLKPYIFKPSLKLDLVDADNPLVQEALPAQDGSDLVRYSCSLVVENNARTPATGCSLRLLSCRRVVVGDRLVAANEGLVAKQLPWIQRKEKTTLHRGYPQKLKLLTVEEAQRSANETSGISGSRSAVLQVHLMEKDGDDQPYVLEVGKYELDFDVVTECGQHRSILPMSIEYSGTWSNSLETMKQNLSITRRES